MRIQRQLILGLVLVAAATRADATASLVATQTPVQTASLDAATPAPSTPNGKTAAEPKVTQQPFGTWMYRCQDVAIAGKPANSVCELDQDVNVVANGNTQTVMRMAFGFPPGDTPGHIATFVLPLGVRLKPGVTLNADKGGELVIPYDFCAPGGCRATEILPKSLMVALRRGKLGQVKIVLNNGQPLVIEYSLNGFAAGLQTLDRNRDKPAAAGE